MTMTDDAPGVELAIRDTATTMVVAGATPEEILGNATQIADALKGLIESQGLSVAVGGDRKHVEVGGWQAAGAMLGALGGQPLHAETVWSRRIDRDDAIVYESRCEVRTLTGEIAGTAEAMCSSSERNWRRSDEYAIRSMAETRAESRAYRRAIGWVVNLAGYSPTPAEEMRAAVAESKPPAWAAAMTDIPGVAHNLTRILEAAGVDDAAAETTRIGNEIFALCDGTFPFALARLAHLLAGAADTPAPEGEREGQMTADATRADADEQAAVNATASDDTTTTKDENA